MVIAEECLAALVRTTSGVPATTLVTETSTNSEVLWNKNCDFKNSGLGLRNRKEKQNYP